MRKRNGTFLLAILFAMMAMASLEAQVVINEVSEDGSVELKNSGNSMVNVGSYWLCDFPTYDRISDLSVECGSMALAPGAILVVNGFDAIDGVDGELGLYTTNSFADPDAIVDYLEWGSAGHQRASVAMQAGIWSPGIFVSSFGAGESIKYDGEGNLDTDFIVSDTPDLCEENDIGQGGCEAAGGTLTGGPFEFCVDGEADFISGIELSGNSGTNSAWIVTDEQGNILGLPPMPSAVDFDEAGPGICLIWHISFEDDLTGLEGGNNVSDLEGCFDISNSVSVSRLESDGGTLIGGPFEFCVDGTPDFVSDITLEGNTGPNNAWIITDEEGNILGLPPMPGVVDFDEAGGGVCLIWNISYQDGLTGLEGGNNVSDLEGCFDISNSISVTRIDADGGTLTGGPFEFCVDGEADFVSGITLEGNSGPNNAWIITDEEGNILGLPPMPGVVDFDAAGPGICLIWNISFEDGLTGLDGGSNVSDLEGCFDISNAVTVTRLNSTAGTLTGGPFEFCVDGTPDFVSDIVLEGNEADTNRWVITDGEGNILGLPPMPGVVDFDAAGTGICLIYSIGYSGNISGLAAGNHLDDITGCFSLTNAVSVVRTTGGAACDDACANEGGVLAGGNFEFCVDGTADFVSGVTVSGNSGSNDAWVVTDAVGNILGIPPSPEVVDFDEAGPGVCIIWNVSYEDGIEGLEGGGNIFDGLVGCYSISTPVVVERNEPSGGTLTGGPFEFCVDGTPDFVSGITLEGNTGPNNAWIITDEEGNILGLPPMPGVVDFDAAGPGICLIWNISFEDGLTGLEGGNNVADLEGCFDISNSVTVTRLAANGGTLTGGPFEFCVDGRADFVSGVELSGQSGDEQRWVVTDEDGNILGLPPSPDAVDFDAAGVGVCFIWNLSYSGEITGLDAGNNVSDITGCFSLSNSVRVDRVDSGGACTTSTLDQNEIRSFTVYPNPASAVTRVQYDLDIDIKDARLSLHDLHGRTIEQFEITAQRDQQDIQLNNLSKGLYLVKLQVNDAVVVRRLVVQ